MKKILFIIMILSSSCSSEVERLHQNSIITDLQNNSLYFHATNRRSFFSNKGAGNYKKIKKGKVNIIFISLTIPDFIISKNYFKLANKMLDKFYILIKELKGEFVVIKDYKDLKRVLKSNKIAVFLSMQGTKAFEGDANNLIHFYNRGVRMISLVHNRDNLFATCFKTSKISGLTKKGKIIIKKMISKKILIDTSHASEKTFLDIYKITGEKYPIIASHSNSFSVTNHKRNLKDYQIKIIEKTGGIIGLCLHSPFLTNDNILAHYKHIANLTSFDILALGSDFDGSNPPKNFRSYEDLINLTSLFYKNGISKKNIKKFYAVNFINLLKRLQL